MLRALHILALLTGATALAAAASILVHGPGGGAADDLWAAPPPQSGGWTRESLRRLWRWAASAQRLGRASRDDRQLRREINGLEKGPRFTAREARLARTIAQARRAAVALAGGSGVNLRPWGLVLTAWHVVEPMRDLPIPVTFATGQRAIGWVVAGSAHTDLALVLLDGAGSYPTAALASREPALRSLVVAVGNPAAASGRRPFHVSLGYVRWYGPRRGLLGDVAYTAWTYFGHSGGPIFDEQGRIVAIHNTLDTSNDWRHGLRLRTVRDFLERAATRYAARVAKVPHG